MLTLLSGRTHQVLTAVAICWEGSTVAEISTSSVTFRALDPRGDRPLCRHEGAARQGRRVRNPGSRGNVRATDRWQSLRHHGAAALRDWQRRSPSIGFPVL
jgi:hypothetical protein